MKVEDLNDEQDEEFCTIISDAFKIDVFSYNSEVTQDFYSVLECVAAKHTYTSEIAEATGLSDTHVELIQYLLCNNDHAEYGTSPRGCWLTEKGTAVYEKLKSMLENPLAKPQDIVSNSR